MTTHPVSPPDGIILRLIGLFWQYFKNLQARAPEGRAVALRSLAAVLRHHGNLQVDYLGPQPQQPYDPQVGAGYLLLEDRYLVDLHLGPGELPAEERQVRLKNNPHPYPVYLLDFSGRLPVWYPGVVPDAPAKRRRKTG
jgi:hypothetical protein